MSVRGIVRGNIVETFTRENISPNNSWNISPNNSGNISTNKNRPGNVGSGKYLSAECPGAICRGAPAIRLGVICHRWVACHPSVGGLPSVLGSPSIRPGIDCYPSWGRLPSVRGSPATSLGRLYQAVPIPIGYTFRDLYLFCIV